MLSTYKKYNKESLQRSLKDFLSTDWLPSNKAKKFPLQAYYADLDLVMRRKKALKDEFIPMEGLCELFDHSNQGAKVFSFDHSNQGAKVFSVLFIGMYYLLSVVCTKQVRVQMLVLASEFKSCQCRKAVMQAKQDISRFWVFNA